MSDLARRLAEIRERPAPPAPDEYADCLTRARRALASEPPEVRPPDPQGFPGGLLRLAPGLPTLLVPDLHARLDFFLGLLGWRGGGAAPGDPAAGGAAGGAAPGEAEAVGPTVLERLEAGELQVLCLGDGMHAEARAARRWKAAQREFLDGYRRHAHMDEEMRESLGLMQMVMECKAALPRLFHFLKGNHENIANEEGGGNHPFVKFALEGFMVAEYMRLFYGEEVLAGHYEFEKLLPLLAAGTGFLASHAEPARFFPCEQVVGFRGDPEVVLGLTWTGDGEAEEGSVGRMLEHYLGPVAGAFYFGGHRPVRGFNLRADGRYVQIHDPERWVLALLPAEGGIDPARDILDIGEVGQ